VNGKGPNLVFGEGHGEGYTRRCIYEDTTVHRTTLHTGVWICLNYRRKDIWRLRADLDEHTT
jgi:hypothetical protein